MQGEHKLLWSFVGIWVLCGALALMLQQRVPPDVPLEQPLRNLSGAARIEIRDPFAQRVLYGEFRPEPATSSVAAHSALLLSSSGDAVGRAEIELVRHPNGALVQEFEVDVAGLRASAAFDVSIDGEPIGTFHTDQHGTAELEQYGRVGEGSKVAD